MSNGWKKDYPDVPDLVYDLENSPEMAEMYLEYMENQNRYFRACEECGELLIEGKNCGNEDLDDYCDKCWIKINMRPNWRKFIYLDFLTATKEEQLAEHQSYVTSIEECLARQEKLNKEKKNG